MNDTDYVSVRVDLRMAEKKCEKAIGKKRNSPAASKASAEPQPVDRKPWARAAACSGAGGLEELPFIGICASIVWS